MTRFRSPISAAALSAAALALLALVACSDPEKVDPTAAPASANDASPASRSVIDAAPKPPEDAAPPEPTMLGAMFMQTPIMNEMEWPLREDDPPRKNRSKGSPTAVRIGYLRFGGRVPVVNKPPVVMPWLSMTRVAPSRPAGFRAKMPRVAKPMWLTLE